MFKIVNFTLLIFTTIKKNQWSIVLCISHLFSLHFVHFQSNSNWEYLKCYSLGFMKHLLQKIKNYLIKNHFFILCSYLYEFEEEILVVFCFLFVYGTSLERNTRWISVRRVRREVWLSYLHVTVICPRARGTAKTETTALFSLVCRVTLYSK